MTEQNIETVYCLYINNNKYVSNNATWYQIEAFKGANEFFKYPNNKEAEFRYSNIRYGYIFNLKKKDYGYEMIKKNQERNKYSQYLVSGEKNRDLLLFRLDKLKIQNSNDMCPICSMKKSFDARYPNAVCNLCSIKTTTKEGHLIDYYNTSPFGGFEGKNTHTGEKTTDHICYINNMRCYADEARFGGIVIQIAQK